MSQVAIAYGPSSVHGVEKIMGIGSYTGPDGIELGTPEDRLAAAGWLSLAALAAGHFVGSDFLRNVGIGGAAVAFGVKYLGAR